jgi:VWFA-related protein
MCRISSLAVALYLVWFGCGRTCSAQPAAARSSTVQGQTERTEAGGQDSTIRVVPVDKAVEAEGVIRVDVEVSGANGKSDAELTRGDFRVFDDGHPQEIVAFQSPADQQPLRIVLLIDALGLPEDLVAFEHNEVAKYLRQAAILPRPDRRGLSRFWVRIYCLEDSGFYLVGTSTDDGRALAEDFDSRRGFIPLFGPRHRPFGKGDAVVDDTYTTSPSLTALRAIGTIAANENGVPGKKLLLWVGPGLLEPPNSWAGSGQYLDNRELNAAANRLMKHGTSFDELYWIMTLLRQARVSVYAFSLGENENDANADAWKKFPGSPPSSETIGMDLYKKVLAVRSGGRVLPPDRDLPGQIAKCIADTGRFYSLTFDPPATTQDNDFHFLSVKLSDAKLTAETVKGYFDEPFYNADPDAGTHRVTIAELEHVISAHEISAHEPLLSFRLTERLSGTKLAELRRKLHWNDERSALDLLADMSAFLPPPASEIPPNPVPDAARQEKILDAVEEYLNQTISKLPDFFATRTAVHYGETAAYRESGVSIKPVALHVDERSRGTVLYRGGKDVVETAKWIGQAGDQHQHLSTNGTFGTLLTLVREGMRSRNNIRWSRWERDGSKLLAVFRIEVPVSRPTVQMKGWRMAYSATIATTFHGDIAVDPSSGAIFRLEFNADLKGFVPSSRSDTLVIYGPVEIEGQEYILPLRSIGIMNLRTAPGLQAWNVGFQTWGPLTTQINDLSFDHYHKFGGTMRILPGFTEVPEKETVH